MSDIGWAESALYERTRLAFDAAKSRGLPGMFETFEQGGLLCALTTSPELAFLNALAGVSDRTVHCLPATLAAYDRVGAPPPSVTVADRSETVAGRLRDRGYVAAGCRPVASTDLLAGPSEPGQAHVGEMTVREVRTEEGRSVFLDLLSAGYDAPWAVREFMAAEHALDALHRFVAWREEQPVAAAAMSVHRGVAVLGGAAVLSTARGAGGQMLLLQHRLGAARAAGCHAAVATAAAGSTSLRNLARSGFQIHPRQGWARSADT